MNKHSRLAFLVAPVLAILGWIASDYWIEKTAPTGQYYPLSAQADYCDIVAKQCILYAGELKLSVYIEGDKTIVNSTLPLDSATLFIVDASGNAQTYPLGLLGTPYYWHHFTDIQNPLQAQGSQQTFRIIATLKGNQFAGEFVSTTLGTDIKQSEQ